VVADRDLALFRARLVEIESMLARERPEHEDPASRALREAAQERVHRDLDLLSAALQRSA
jgi:hypothetical protein